MHFNPPRLHGKGLNPGFTLLEVLVSLAIIATVLVSIMRLQSQTISMNETVRFYCLAPFLAQSKLAEVQMDPESFSGTDSGDFGSSFPEYDWQVRVEEKEFLLPEEDEAAFLLLDAQVVVRHSAWGLRYELNRQLPDRGGERRQ